VGSLKRIGIIYTVSEHFPKNYFLMAKGKRVTL
jgi:hypothetical protein